MSIDRNKQIAAIESAIEAMNVILTELRAANNAAEITLRVMTVDVWGNADDGYEINDWVTIIDRLPVAALNDFAAFCRVHLKGDPEQYVLRDYGSTLEVQLQADGMPILQMEYNQ